MCQAVCVFAAVAWFVVEKWLRNFINRCYKNPMAFFVKNRWATTIIKRGGFMKTNKIDARRLRRMAGLFTIGEAANLIGINVWTLYNELRAERLPRPKTTIVRGTRCYYTTQEVERLKRLLDN